MAISRTPIVDDDGSGNTGTVIDNAWKQEFYDQIDAASLVPMEVVASNAPVVMLSPNYRRHEVRFYGIVLHGFSKAGTQEGDEVIVLNAAGNFIELPDESVTATTALDRLSNFVTSAPTRLSTIGAATYVRDYRMNVPGTPENARWRLVSHEQGAPIQAPHANGNFTQDTGTWTVEAGDNLIRYYLKGRMLTIQLEINASSTSTATSTSFNVLNAAYGGYLGTQVVMQQPVILDLPAAEMGRAFHGTSYGIDNRIILTRLTNAAFPAVTNTLNIHGLLTFEVG
jgi:hypothetical protein